MNTVLHPYLHEQPHWVQLGTQACVYGFFCWLADCAESPTPLNTPTVYAAMCRADEQFAAWPADCFEHLAQSLLLFLKQEQQELTEDRIHDLYGEAEDIFRDIVPVDLFIFHLLATGEPLTDEQWERLWNSLAFIPFQNPPKDRQKTRRIHGRRAITPMRRHKRFRAITLHKRIRVPQLIKES